jgi:4-amino-4-deoxy-L-arabinose transferase-like glycosyltransferase
LSILQAISDAPKTATKQIPPARNNGRTFWLWLSLILTVGAILRLYGLSHYPAKFDQDEAVLGYDSWSLIRTLRDQHGNFLPVFFKTYNDYVPPVPNYLAAPFVGTLGLSVFAIRLPFALLSIATLFLTALLARRWFGTAPALVTTALLTIEPWYFIYSRIAYPAVTVPFFTVLALYSFTRGIGYLSERPRAALFWLIGSGASFALLAGTYTPMKLQSVLLMGGCALAGLGIFWKAKWHAAAWIGSAALVAAPMLYTQLRYWEAIQTHFKDLSITSQPNWLLVFFNNHAAHYDFSRLLYSSFKAGYVPHPSGIGQVFWLEPILWGAAIIALATLPRRVNFALWLLLIIWFLTFPVASSLTEAGIPHEVRSIAVLPLPQLLAGLGAVFIWQKLSAYRWRKISLAQVAAIPAVTLWAFFGWLWLSDYFAPPVIETALSPREYEKDPNIGLKPVLLEVERQVTPCDVLWIEEKNQVYIHYLFYTQFPPDQLQKADKGDYYDDQGWLRTIWINNVNFGRPDQPHPKYNYQQPPGCAGKTSRLFFVTRTVYVGSEWTQITASRNTAGQPVWRAFMKNM